MAGNLLGRLERLEAANEAAKIEKKSAQIDPLSLAFKEQLDFITDPARWKFAETTRRAAKSTAVALDLINTATKQSGNVLFVGNARPDISQNFWEPVFKPMLERLGIPATINETKMAARFPNGNWLYTFGVDASDSQKKKLRGGKYRKVAIDEAQSLEIDLSELVDAVLQPSLADLQGTLTLTGTPGKICIGYWYDVTHGNLPGWSAHRWSASANPHIRWDDELATLRARTPGIEKTARWRREFEGLWVPDDQEATYWAYQEPRNVYDELPPYAAPWRYMLGIDLGWEHPTALVVGAFHPNDYALHIVSAEKRRHWLPSELAARIKALTKEHGILASDIIVDPASAQVIADLEERLGLTLTAAKKPGREEMISLLNDEFTRGAIKLHRGTCDVLVSEFKTLMKDAETGDDAADAFRYLWRAAYPYLSKPLAPKPDPGTAEWQAAEVAAMKQRAIDAVLRKERSERGDDGDFFGGPIDGSDW